MARNAFLGAIFFVTLFATNAFAQILNPNDIGGNLSIV